MKALLKTYTLDTLTEAEAIELPENYDGDPYGNTVPFSVGSNQTIEVIENALNPNLQSFIESL